MIFPIIFYANSFSQALRLAGPPSIDVELGHCPSVLEDLQKIDF